jgi:hypothetical protein
LKRNRGLRARLPEPFLNGIYGIWNNFGIFTDYVDDSIILIFKVFFLINISFDEAGVPRKFLLQYRWLPWEVEIVQALLEVSLWIGKKLFVLEAK